MHDEDRALVDAIGRGDERAFEALVVRTHGKLVAIARRIVPPSLAEDIAQQTWEAVVRGIGNFDGRSPLETWIVQIALNRARSARRNEKKHESTATDDPLASQFDAIGRWSRPLAHWAIDGHASPGALASQRELLTTLGRALDELPELQRLVVAMRDIEGLDATSVCEALAITEANQRVLLHRGRTRLRCALDAVLTVTRACSAAERPVA